MYIYPGIFEGGGAKGQWYGAALGPQVGPQKLPMARQIHKNELKQAINAVYRL